MKGGDDGGGGEAADGGFDVGGRHLDLWLVFRGEMEDGTLIEVL